MTDPHERRAVPQCAAYCEYGTAWVWGRVTKSTAKTASVEPWHDGDGGYFGGYISRRNVADCVIFDNSADAAALVKAIADLNNRESDTRRQYNAKRTALVAAARAAPKGRENG